MTVPSKDYLLKLAAVGRGEIIKGTCKCGREGRERMNAGGLLTGCWCDVCHEKRERNGK